jgi:hypothetical protein
MFVTSTNKWIVFFNEGKERKADLEKKIIQMSFEDVMLVHISPFCVTIMKCL